ncbi:MAG: hypothetical protein ACK4L7_04715, partial [Flavobacteriales bacterium]
FQAWQYEAGILHPFNMDREKHALVFLRADEGSRHRFGDAQVAELFAPHGWDTLAVASLTGDSVAVIGGDRPYSPTLRIGGEALPAGRELFADISLRRRALEPLASDTARLVYAYASPRGQRIHESFPLNDIARLDDTRWRHWRYAFNLPEAETDEELAIYLWQPGRGRVAVRDFQVMVRARRDQ